MTKPAAAPEATPAMTSVQDAKLDEIRKRHEASAANRKRNSTMFGEDYIETLWQDRAYLLTLLSERAAAPAPKMEREVVAKMYFEKIMFSGGKAPYPWSFVSRGSWDYEAAFDAADKIIELVASLPTSVPPPMLTEAEAKFIDELTNALVGVLADAASELTPEDEDEIHADMERMLAEPASKVKP